MNSDFGNWLAGFIDGEGCFMIKPAGNGFVCEFTLRVRADEQEILEEIVRETEIGFVANDRGYQNVQGYISYPLAIWKICTKSGCQNLAKLLTVHPMRAKKKRDFAHWKNALDAWSRVKRGRDNRVQFLAMKAAKHAMQLGRAYDR